MTLWIDALKKRIRRIVKVEMEKVLKRKVDVRVLRIDFSRVRTDLSGTGREGVEVELAVRPVGEEGEIPCIAVFDILPFMVNERKPPRLLQLFIGCLR
jgi:hypothetical protein